MESLPPGVEEREVPDEPPPFLGEWRRVYAATIAYLCALIALFWIFAEAFRP